MKIVIIKTYYINIRIYMHIHASLPVSILCVLIDNKDVDLIYELCQKNKYCWYPFGNRFQKLNEICKYLYKNKFIVKQLVKNFILYECTNTQYIIFYLHKSRTQKGSATINQILLVDKIIISEYSTIEIKDETQNAIPTRPVSNVWLHIKQVKTIATIDASCLIKHHLFNEKIFNDKRYNFQHYPDGKKLYKSVLPIKEKFFTKRFS